jgi:choline dehydrogenase-like flavoprotein
MCAEKCWSPYDAVIVGSGIAGALIAKQLGLAGKKVLVMEAGAEMPPNVNEYMERFYTQSAKVPEIPYTPELFDSGGLVDPATVNAGRPTVLTLGATRQPGQKDKRFGDWKDPTQAYLVQNGKLPFGSTYERINGGTVRHWLGTSLRFVPADFEMKKRYNQFVDWPLGYNDLEKWYGLAEIEIGVSADRDEQQYLGITINKPYPMPRILPSMVDEAVAAGTKGLTIDGITLKVSNTPAARNSQPYQARRVCAGNTNCIPICPIQAKYDPSVTLADALRTGNVEIWYRTVASDIEVGENGRISQINYIKYKTDKGPRTETGCVSANVFILAGNAIETPRLLLMSNKQRPAGVANATGLVGKNLMDHPLYLGWAMMPEGKPAWGYRGPLSTGGIEDMRDGPFRKERGAFRIEIGNEGWNFPIGDPHTTTLDLINGMNLGQLNPSPKALFGKDLVTKLNDLLTRQFRLGFLVEQSPDQNNRVTLADGKDKTKVDHLGLPRPQITYDLSDYTKKGLAAAKDTASRIFQHMGAKEFTKECDDDPSQFVWPPGGKDKIKYYGAGHIVGTYRMGPKGQAVVDREQRSWDHPNLYMVGSGVFPTVATANPTLTLAALCLWCADTILKKDLH